MISPKNTEKIRRNNLLESQIEIIGKRNGSVFIRAIRPGESPIMYQCEENVLPIHFDHVPDLESISSLNADIYSEIRANCLKFM